jgi:hypothetical protein
MRVGWYEYLVSVPVIVCMSICILYNVYAQKDKTSTIIPQRGKSGKTSCWGRRKRKVEA